MNTRTFKLLVLANNLNWTSLPEKLEAVRAFYAPACDLDIELRHTALQPIFARYPDVALPIIDHDWYDANLAAPNALKADIILFITEPGTVTTYQGYMNQNTIGPWETTVYVHGENDHTFIDGIDLGNSFVLTACHELSHVFYRMVTKPDATHRHFPSAGDPPCDNQPSWVLADFDFGTRSATLEWCREHLIAMLTALKLIDKRVVCTATCQMPQNGAGGTGAPKPTPTPAPAPKPTPASNPDEIRHPWSDPVIAHHNVRALCDLRGLTGTIMIDGKAWLKKDVLTACVYQESEFRNWKADGSIMRNDNWAINKTSGHRYLASTDWGLVQINDWYHIGPGKDFPSVQYVGDNPQTCVEWMIDYFKTHGHLNAWVSFSSGAYKQWLGKV